MVRVDGRGMTVMVLWMVLVDDAGRCTLEFGVTSGSGMTVIVDVRWIVASVDD